MIVQRAPVKGVSTVGSIVGLLAGLVVGSLCQRLTEPVLVGASDAIAALGSMWVRALQMVVLPLVLSQLVVAIVGSGRTSAVGRMAVVAVILFVVLLAAAALFTVCLTPLLIDLFTFDPAAVANLKKSIPQAAVGAAPSAAPSAAPVQSFFEWLVALVPSNPFKAAANGELLQLLVFTICFSLALTRIASERRELLVKVFAGLTETMFVVVGWLLRVLPVAVFALSFSFARKTGLEVVGLLLQFVAIACLLMFAFTLMLYVPAVLVGGVPLRAFAAALYPAQVVAVGSRSSLASLPALLDGAKYKLDLPQPILGFALPFAASTFKVNRTITGPLGLMFLSYWYDKELSATMILAFVVTVMIMSFSSPGIPSGGDTMKSLPAYLAAGIPLEGVIMIKAVDVIPDIFKTLVNVTGYMAVTVMLDRLIARPSPADSQLPLDPLPQEVG